MKNQFILRTYALGQIGIETLSASTLVGAFSFNSAAFTTEIMGKSVASK
jgi:hypothetical protein